jgi:hypothetical protein
MELKLSTFADVGKKMTTTRQKDSELVTCQIAAKGVRVSREAMDELSGLPIGCTAPLYDELGAPHQRMSFLLPKRGLIADGTLQLRKDSGAVTAELELKKAIAGDLRFNLDTPDDQGPTAMLSFTLLWKAAGDEVSDVEPLLDQKVYLELKLRDPPQEKLALGSAPSPKAEAAAGHKAKLDRKRQAAGEKPSDNDPAPKPGMRPAVGGVGPKFEREARERAQKNPRKDPPRATTHKPRSR